jgi:hypothetical protein
MHSSPVCFHSGILLRPEILRFPEGRDVQYNIEGGISTGHVSANMGERRGIYSMEVGPGLTYIALRDDIPRQDDVLLDIGHSSFLSATQSHHL